MQVLKGAYEATLAVAALKAIHGASAGNWSGCSRAGGGEEGGGGGGGSGRVKVFLTALGGGAFGKFLKSLNYSGFTHTCIRTFTTLNFSALGYYL